MNPEKDKPNSQPKRGGSHTQGAREAASGEAAGAAEAAVSHGTIPSFRRTEEPESDWSGSLSSMVPTRDGTNSERRCRPRLIATPRTSTSVEETLSVDDLPRPPRPSRFELEATTPHLDLTERPTSQGRRSDRRGNEPRSGLAIIEMFARLDRPQRRPSTINVNRTSTRPSYQEETPVRLRPDPRETVSSTLSGPIQDTSQGMFPLHPRVVESELEAGLSVATHSRDVQKAKQFAHLERPELASRVLFNQMGVSERSYSQGNRRDRHGNEETHQLAERADGGTSQGAPPLLPRVVRGGLSLHEMASGSGQRPQVSYSRSVANVSGEGIEPTSSIERELGPARPIHPFMPPKLTKKSPATFHFDLVERVRRKREMERREREASDSSSSDEPVHLDELQKRRPLDQDPYEGVGTQPLPLPDDATPEMVADFFATFPLPPIPKWAQKEQERALAAAQEAELLGGPAERQEDTNPDDEQGDQGDDEEEEYNDEEYEYNDEEYEAIMELCDDRIVKRRFYRRK